MSLIISIENCCVFSTESKAIYCLDKKLLVPIDCIVVNGARTMPKFAFHGLCSVAVAPTVLFNSALNKK